MTSRISVCINKQMQACSLSLSLFSFFFSAWIFATVRIQIGPHAGWSILLSPYDLFVHIHPHNQSPYEEATKLPPPPSAPQPQLSFPPRHGCICVDHAFCQPRNARMQRQRWWQRQRQYSFFISLFPSPLSLNRSNGCTLLGQLLIHTVLSQWGKYLNRCTMDKHTSSTFQGKGRQTEHVPVRFESHRFLSPCFRSLSWTSNRSFSTSLYFYFYIRK